MYNENDCEKFNLLEEEIENFSDSLNKIKTGN